MSTIITLFDTKENQCVILRVKDRNEAAIICAYDPQLVGRWVLLPSRFKKWEDTQKEKDGLTAMEPKEVEQRLIALD